MKIIDPRRIGLPLAFVGLALAACLSSSRGADGFLTLETDRFT